MSAHRLLVAALAVPLLLGGCSSWVDGTESFLSKINPFGDSEPTPVYEWRRHDGQGDPTHAQADQATCQHQLQRSLEQSRGEWEPWPTKERIRGCMLAKGWYAMPEPKPRKF